MVRTRMATLAAGCAVLAALFLAPTAGAAVLTVTVPGTSDATPAGYVLGSVTINTTGAVCLANGACGPNTGAPVYPYGPWTPAGGTPACCSSQDPAAPIGALIAKVGSDPWQFVGASGTVSGSGPLMLATNDCLGCYGDNSGEFTATVDGGLAFGEASSNVTANLVPTISISAPASIDFGNVVYGQTYGPKNAPVTVTSNDAAGYQLTVSRTAFSPTDIPLSIELNGSLPSGTVSDLVSPLVAIPTTPPDLKVGHSGSITPLSGDVWPTALVLGPVPWIASGTYNATVTFTAVGF
jgi:hypothetical protein